jgi:hypothetical protein
VNAAGAALLLMLGALSLPQRPRAADGPLPNATLDAWTVTRYRGAQFLPDTLTPEPSLSGNGPLPHVDAVRGGRVSDTLFAVQFNARVTGPALAPGATVRLAGPTGTITTLSARIVARRAFRAPRSPAPGSNWRYGWAYLAVVTHNDARSAARYRGWLLIDSTDPAHAPGVRDTIFR